RATDEMAGYALAERLGCHGCHGPRGVGGTPNPGSKEMEIPSWDGGTPMMYAESEAELREWILDGVPKRLAQEHEHAHDHTAGRTSLPIHMPAYRDIIRADQVDLLVSYVKAVALWDPLPEAALRGRRTAARLGCFGCHGPGGMIGMANAGSFKGYIPPWRGKDFAELVRNDAELRSWILDGKIARFESNAIARFFTRRQVIQMPAYRDVVTDTEVDDIVAYIQELSKEAE
ncbi:MAG TPA: c-type cytochrome, partial [Candidatus Krumholzibacteria bacterium]|nr:c-type cytochrome [Candidatus Krumholzibacteria bacterium]